MKRNEVFKGKFFKADDVGSERGDHIELVIDGIKLEEVGFGDNREERAVVYFKNHDKKLVLNSTNWDTLAEFFGDESDNWSGEKVSVFRDITNFAGKRVACLRIRAADPDPGTEHDGQEEF